MTPPPQLSAANPMCLAERFGVVLVLPAATRLTRAAVLHWVSASPPKGVARLVRKNRRVRLSGQWAGTASARKLKVNLSCIARKGEAMASELKNSARQWSVLASSTLAFTVCFMVWMMLGVVGIPLKQQLGLNETEFGMLAAMPVLTGSLVRVPLGIWTDRFGGRIVFFVLMLTTVLPIYLMEYATAYWHFFGDRPVYRPGGRLVFGGHPVCGALVSQGPARPGDGGVWRG